MTGLFFGSFNPIHNGHVAIARYLLDNGYCEKVWFVVSPCNPFKVNQDLLPEEKRLEIVKAAIEGDERMQVCDVEFTMPRPSYTMDTLKRLSTLYSHECFGLIMGGDNLRNFHLWRDYEKILSGYKIWVYPRPGVKVQPMNSRIELVDAPLSDVSSTDIRRKLAAGENIFEDVPWGARELILRYYSS